MMLCEGWQVCVCGPTAGMYIDARVHVRVDRGARIFHNHDAWANHDDASTPPAGLLGVESMCM